MSWRWDQGRLDYFRVRNVRRIAEVLIEFDGDVISGTGVRDILRQPLTVATGLLFPPTKDPTYKVWRNFGRVFGQQLLATQVDRTLRVTELCRRMSGQGEPLTDEEYIQFWVKRYTSPSPSFGDYDPNGPVVFPFCAIIKLALARLSQGGGSVKAEDVVACLIGNNASGEEDLRFYLRLRPTSLVLPRERVRQIREMIAVLGQIPFLKWESSALTIDTSAISGKFEADIMAYATPQPSMPRLAKEQEILNQGSVGYIALPSLDLPESSMDEITFIEGSRRRMTHLRIERSSKLRQIYLSRARNAALCNMCTLDTQLMYPWTNRLIEVHHLLPLGSLLKIDSKSTSLADVVGVCPNCHKATHHFYKNWLTDHALEDFRSEAEAREVFMVAKERVVRAA